jgi:hypothetical protein
MGSAYVIKEDPVREDLLYVGTEFGLYVSMDRGKSWTQWKTNFPTVAVHDLVIHPREKEIVLATHGRGMWIAPVEPLQQATDTVLGTDVALFDPIEAVQWANDRSGGYGDGDGWFYGSNPPPGARLTYYLKADASDVKLEILAADGTVLWSVNNPPKTKGVNVAYWPFRTTPGGPGGGGGGGQGGFGGAAVSRAGTYGVRLTADGKSITKRLSVKADPLISR